MYPASQRQIIGRIRAVLLVLLFGTVLILPGACAVRPPSSELIPATAQSSPVTPAVTAAPASTTETAEETKQPAETPSPEATKEPSPEPTAQPTAEPTPSPTTRPAITRQPTLQNTPSVAPTAVPTTAEPAHYNAVVGLGLGKDHAATTAQAIANAGGLNRIVKSGSTVLIKPNLCWSNITSRPVNTDYRVVAEIVRQVKALGAGRIIIAEGPFGPECFSEAMLAYNHYDKIKGVELISLNVLTEDDCYERTGRNSVTGKALFIPKIYVDADVVITVAKMKTHNAGMVTLGLKNAFGVPPRSIYSKEGALSGSKIRLHEDYDFNKAIVEINLIRTPDFVVIDGIVAGEGSGPLKNTSVDAQIIIAGRDIVAVDTVAAAFMGFNPEKIPHLALAHAAGLGEGDLAEIKVVGGYLPDLIIDFDSIFPKD